MMDCLTALTGEAYQITPQIAVRNPTLREIYKYGEQQYFGLTQTICAAPADRKVEIWDAMGVYWDKVDGYELFLSTFRAVQQHDTKILFGDLDIASFQPMPSKNLKDFVLVNRDGAVIDRAVYKLLTDYLRHIHMFKKNVVKPYDDYTREIMIEADRDDREDAANKSFRSILKPLVSSAINLPGSQFRWDTVWDAPIGVFMDSIMRMQKRDRYFFTMIGIYSGCVDIKKINKKELEWMSDDVHG